MFKIDFLITRDRCRAEEGNKRDINLVRAFLKKGYSCGMISGCRLIHSQLKKEGIFSFLMHENIKIPLKLENMVARAGRIQDKYNIPSLKRFIFPEKCYYNEDEDYLFRKAIVYFEELEKLFDQFDIKCLVQSQGGQINIRALYFIAKKRGIPVIYFGEHLFPGRILLFSDEMKNHFGFKNINWEKMTEKQREEVEVLIKEFKEKRKVIGYSLMKTRKDKAMKSFISLQEYVRNTQFKGLKDAVIRKFKKRIGNTANQFLSSFLYQKGIKDEKFIYFPLHVSDDSQITLRNPQFFNQANLALYIARSLPFGYKLYVKEHPGSFLAVRSKRELVKEKNVAVLNPNINSHQVVEKSKAVIVINSTVGFEALHYFKPVIILGNWGLLKGKGITADVEDISKLDIAIKSALEEKIEPTKIKAFLFSLKESMLEGSVMAPTMDYDKVADLLIKRCKELSHEK